MDEREVSSIASGGWEGLSDEAKRLELRVWGAGGREVRRRIREQLTIGRALACDLVIEGPGVNLIHARVICGVNGWELDCVGRSRVEVRDEQTRELRSVDRVELGVGVRFWVEGAGVECVEAETEENAPSPQPSPEYRRGSEGSEAAVFAEAPRLVMCPVCYRNLEGVPGV